MQWGVTGWVDTTAREIETFLGFVLATLIHRVPRLNNIWLGAWGSRTSGSLHQDAFLAAVVQSPPCRQHSGTRLQWSLVWSAVQTQANAWHLLGRFSRGSRTITATLCQRGHGAIQEAELTQAVHSQEADQVRVQDLVLEWCKWWLYLQEFQIYTGKGKKSPN